MRSLLAGTVVSLGVLTGGCWGLAVDQSPACATYVRCIQAGDVLVDQTTNLDRYLVDGVCWGNPELGRGCTTSCTRALDRLRARTPALPVECAP